MIKKNIDIFLSSEASITIDKVDTDKIFSEIDSGEVNIPIDKVDTNKIFSEVDLSIYKGKDGYTPIKGVDYFTEEDIEGLEEIFALKDHTHDYIGDYPASGSIKTNIHVGDNAPIDDDLQAWIDTSDDEEFMQDVSDLVLDEFRNIFNSLQEQISLLKLKNSELEARVYYLETYGTGNPEVSSGNILVLEDKTILTLEDGTILTFE